jgi:hypothetical protein
MAGIAQKLRGAVNGTAAAVQSAAAGIRYLLVDEIWAFRKAGHRAAKYAKWAAMRETRRDLKIEQRLNATLRQRFIDSLNASDLSGLSVETNDMIRAYKTAHERLGGPFLSTYRAFQRLPLPVRIGAGIAFSLTLRTALWGLMGPWGVLIPASTFAVARYRDWSTGAHLSRLERKLEDAGLVTPLRLTVHKGAPHILGRAVTSDLPFAYPLLRTGEPQWMAGAFRPATGDFTASRKLHAATFEALRYGVLGDAALTQIERAFPGYRSAQSCAAALAVLFPQKKLDEVLDMVRGYNARKSEMPAAALGKTLRGSVRRAAAAAKGNIPVPMTEAILGALNDFCIHDRPDARALKGERGLSALAGKIDAGDLLYLARLKSLGVPVGPAQAHDAASLLHRHAYDRLSFKQAMEVALMTAPDREFFDDMWRDSAWNARFSYDEVRDMAANRSGWGGTAIVIARNDYAKRLSYAQIRELADPANENWARAFHKYSVEKPEIAANLSYDDLKTVTRQMGQVAGLALDEFAKGAATPAQAMERARAGLHGPAPSAP